MRILRLFIGAAALFFLAYADNNKTIIFSVGVTAIAWEIAYNIYRYIRIYKSGEEINAKLTDREIPLSWGSGLNIFHVCNILFSFEYNGTRVDEIKPLGYFIESPCKTGETIVLKYLSKYPEVAVIPVKGKKISYIVLMNIALILYTALSYGLLKV